MSKIAIIGATGRAGSQLLEEALRRGHSVTAIARNTRQIGARAGVVSKNVDVLDAAALQDAVSRQRRGDQRRAFRHRARQRRCRAGEKGGGETLAGGGRCRFAVAAGRYVE